MNDILGIFNSVAAAHGIVAVKCTKTDCSECTFDNDDACPTVLCCSLENAIGDSCIIAFDLYDRSKPVKYENIENFVLEASDDIRTLASLHG